MFRLTKQQKDWLGAADPEQVRRFCARGPATVAPVANIRTGETGFAPMLRGCRTDASLPDADAAQRLAEQRLAELQASVQPFTDEEERALGIDGRCLQQAELCEQHDLRIEAVLHLGSLLYTEALEESRFGDEPLEHLLDVLCDPGLQLHSSLAALVPPRLHEAEADDDSVEGVLADYWIHHGICGFALQISTPVRRYHSNRFNSWSASWGHKVIAWVYGESFEQAFEHALAWVKEEIEQQKQRQAS